MNYYDDKLKSTISELQTNDKMKLIESLFNGMISSLISFYEYQGYTEREIDAIVVKRVEDIRKIVSARIAAKSKDKIFTEKFRKVPMDDQFMNDAKIDMEILIQSLSNPK